MKLDKTTQEFKDKLIKKRAELLKRLSQYKEKERTSSEFQGDDVDRAISGEDKEMIFTMSNRDREELRAIDSALKKVSDGSYGVCEECKKNITKKRLKILPFTRYCKDCQAEMET